ncbi:protein ERGIC-53-like [Hydractinia symbiolongicarpus]|uniref:protein ERGIC-53-like n=1 Tax=Hydractinia symbiolongicarpus TaxID=13093 RepID=UPI002549F8E1|nr:protein ERGIC-53-like [Hydractinia symbiolongicarpus]
MAAMKMFGHVALVVLLALSSILCEEGRHSRFEYKHSFKGPHLVNKQGNVPFWTHYGSAIPSDEQVRITPSLKDQRGSLWSKVKSTNEFWEVEVFFRISGRGRVGGDGLAVWFTEEMGKPGPVFGSSDNWKGMGLFFDSFDNDGEQNNPYVMVMLNDGTKQYDHFKDGNNQQLGGCMRDFRNRPHPIRAKIRYYNNILTVFYHGGMSERDEDYELCMRAENVHLPKEGFFGVSAATGGLADDHDVIKFLTHSLTPPISDEQKQKVISEEQRKKYESQYGEYQQKLETQREEFQKEHPEKKPVEEKYESVYDRDVRLIYEGQNAVHQIVRDLHSKTGELTHEVNNLHTAVNSKRSAGDVGGEGVSKQEINTFISMLNQVKTGVENLRSQDGGGSDTRRLDQIEQNLRTVLENVGHLLSKGQDGGKKSSCPTLNCLTPGYFIFFMIAQVCLMVGYTMYQNHLSQSAKKFY